MLSKSTAIFNLAPHLHKLKPKPLKPLSSLSNPFSSISSSPLPLFLHPLTHTTTHSSLDTFKSWAKSLSYSPHLHQQLKYFLEDTTFETPTSIFLRTDLQTLYKLWQERVEQRKPLQYIVGCEHWRDLVLVVMEGVLIPRPETEILVDVVERVEGFGDGVWVDLGTGSGALAIGIGKLIKEKNNNKGRVLGIDVSPIAVEVAKLNVKRYSLEGVVEIRQGEWFDPIEDFRGKIAGIVSNPPYIPTEDLSSLQPEVGWYEPRLALDGGKDGIAPLVRICEEMGDALKPGGFFAFETNGDKQSEFLVDLLSTKWREFFERIKIVSDYSGVKRFVTGYRR